MAGPEIADPPFIGVNRHGFPRSGSNREMNQVARAIALHRHADEVPALQQIDAKTGPRGLCRRTLRRQVGVAQDLGDVAAGNHRSMHAFARCQSFPVESDAPE